MCVKALNKFPGLTSLDVVVLEEFETYEYARRCIFKVDSFFYRDPDEAKDQETNEGAAPVAYFGVADRISNDQWGGDTQWEGIERNLDQRTRRNKKQFWKQPHQFNQTKMIPPVSSNSLSRNVRHARGLAAHT
ncbi:uncharacterized protein LOC113290141 isoform X2 [Papaver somniferum]|uniref:uncharacterized protein LOC113290141 isoform X2 n=1 Tax=Papaver somniferum TaxID=3469 RepID=UPI000E6FA442|nr:uncharacterized protein LOC113290141 isoform X2 [Papaver somniferum]